MKNSYFAIECFLPPIHSSLCLSQTHQWVTSLLEVARFSSEDGPHWSIWGLKVKWKCAVLWLLPNTGSNSLRCSYNVNVASLVWFCLCWTHFLPDVWKSRNQICINGLVLVWFLNSCTCSNSLTCNFSTLTHLSSSTSHRLPPASPSTHSIAGASGTSSSSSTPSSRLSRGSTVRSTFHGGQIRDRRPPSHAPPASPTLSHDASPLPHARTRGTTNLLSKITSKLTRR